MPTQSILSERVTLSVVSSISYLRFSQSPVLTKMTLKNSTKLNPNNFNVQFAIRVRQDGETNQYHLVLSQETTWELCGSLSKQCWCCSSWANELVLSGEETVWLCVVVCHNTGEWMIPYISYHTDRGGHYHDHHMLHNAQCNPTTNSH